jgi:hypothetical protein
MLGGRSSVRSFLALGCSLIALALGATARADDKDACVSAHEAGQADRKAGRLRAARAQFVACSRAACPRIVQADCTELLAKVESSQPTVVVDVTDATGNPPAEVLVSIDDDPPRRFDGTAIPVDPGPHHLSVRAGPDPARTLNVVLLEGDKNRRVVFDFRPLTATPARPTAFVMPTAAWVFGAVAAVGFTSFAVFGTLGKVQQGQLDACARICKSGDVDVMYQRYAVADASLVTAGVSLGAAVVVALVFGRRTTAAGGVQQRAAMGMTF